MILLNLSGKPLLKTVPEDCKSRLLALPIFLLLFTDSKLFPKSNEPRACSFSGLHTTSVSLAYRPGHGSPFAAVPAPAPAVLHAHPRAGAQRGPLSTMDRDCSRRKPAVAATEHNCRWVLDRTTKHVQAFMAQISKSIGFVQLPS